MKYFKKKRWASEVICFRKYRLQKAQLLKCPKSPCLRTLWDSQHVKGCERLLTSARQYFCHIFWSLWKISSSRNSVLVVSKILRLLVNILIPDDKYSLSVKASVEHNKFKCSYLETKKYFLDFFLHFRNLHKIWNALKKKLISRGDFFLKL